MRALLSDIHAAFRALLASRGTVTLSVAMLSGALALCLVVTALVNAYVVRGLPYPEAERLYRVDYSAPGQAPPRHLADLEWASLHDVIELGIAWDLDVFYLLGGEYPEAAPGSWVTPAFLRGFGVTPHHGRTFDAADFSADAPAVAMISHRLWHTRFGGRTDVLGQVLQAYVSDRPEEPETFTIVGVLPPEFWHFNTYTEVFAPLKASTYPYQVRLRDGVSAELATSRIDALVRQNLEPDAVHALHVVLTPTLDSYVAPAAPLLWSVAAAAGLVLLIAGANVAVLMLIRASRRRRDIAVRLSLGAGPRRIARMLALEGMMIGVLATAVALLVSVWGLARLRPVVADLFQRGVPGGADALVLDPFVAILASGASVAISLVFTLAPVAVAWRKSVTGHLLASGRATTDSAATARTRSALIALEVAVSLTLLTGASLMVHSATRMLDVEFGFVEAEVMTASLALRHQTFPDAVSRLAFFERLMTEVEGIRGVGDVALGDWWPMQSGRARQVQASGVGAERVVAHTSAVSAKYFSTLGIPLVQGRPFGEQDTLGSLPVVVVSASLAQRLWPNGDAVGQTIVLQGTDDEPETRASVIGIAGDVRQSHRDHEFFDAYLSLAQQPGRFAYLYLRPSNRPGWESELRTAAARVHREVAIGTPLTLDAGLERERARPRLLATMLVTFALVATALALLGIYGVIAYAARQRRREIAIRLALGAERGVVMTLFLRQGLVVLGGGLLAGAAGAWAIGRILQSLLFDVSASELQLHAAVAGGLALCAILAVWWPARRAAAIDPSLLLREE